MSNYQVTPNGIKSKPSTTDPDDLDMSSKMSGLDYILTYDGKNPTFWPRSNRPRRKVRWNEVLDKAARYAKIAGRVAALLVQIRGKPKARDLFALGMGTVDVALEVMNEVQKTSARQKPRDLDLVRSDPLATAPVGRDEAVAR